MAATVIGGLISSTILTLIVVPVIYEILFTVAIAVIKIGRILVPPASINADFISIPDFSLLITLYSFLKVWLQQLLVDLFLQRY
jgi:hypothetical protein